MIENVFYIYLALVNTAAFLLFWSDKRRARNHKWRVPEKNLFFISIIGGSIGAVLGMWICRHKTKHWYFVIGMPAILAVQVIAVYLVWNRLL